MLKVDADKRFTPEMCLSHAWFTEFVPTEMEKKPTIKIDPTVIERLRAFRHGSKLRITLLNIIVRQLHSDKYAHLTEQFQLIDKDGTGVIRREELKDIMNSVNGLEIDGQEFEQVINEIDYDNNGTINYSEFLAATVPIEKYVSDH